MVFSQPKISSTRFATSLADRVARVPRRARIEIRAAVTGNVCSGWRIRSSQDSSNLFPTFTVEENVASPLEFMGLGWREARQKAAGALALVGLGAPVLHRRPA